MGSARAQTQHIVDGANYECTSAFRENTWFQHCKKMDIWIISSDFFLKKSLKGLSNCPFVSERLQFSPKFHFHKQIRITKFSSSISKGRKKRLTPREKVTRLVICIKQCASVVEQ